ncbi:MAG: hypothetical protein LUG84_00265 [Akkermansiaceae bacterium]|nr:hypothetical protein [Akkermansiaceae bacterium]
MKITVLYIATGRYTVFWDEFYATMTKYFLPDCERHVILFTDRPETFQHPALSTRECSVTLVKIRQEPWPFQTLFRYRLFLEHAALWSKADYVFFINADYVFFQEVSRAILPTPDEGGLVVAEHRKSLELDVEEYPYERNPASAAFIPAGKGEHYFAGGFNGGAVPAFLELCRSISKATQEDLEHNIVAVWHDESHLNRYLLGKPVKVLPPEFVWPEYAMNRRNRGRIICGPRDKDRYGGHAWLRGATDVKKKSKFRRRLPKYCILTALAIVLAAGILHWARWL